MQLFLSITAVFYPFWIWQIILLSKTNDKKYTDQDLALGALWLAGGTSAFICGAVHLVEEIAGMVGG